MDSGEILDSSVDAAVHPKNAPKLENRGTAQQTKIFPKTGSLLLVTFVGQCCYQQDRPGTLCLGNLRHPPPSPMDFGEILEPSSSLTHAKLHHRPDLLSSSAAKLNYRRLSPQAFTQLSLLSSLADVVSHIAPETVNPASTPLAAPTSTNLSPSTCDKSVLAQSSASIPAPSTAQIYSSPRSQFVVTGSVNLSLAGQDFSSGVVVAPTSALSAFPASFHYPDEPPLFRRVSNILSILRLHEKKAGCWVRPILRFYYPSPIHGLIIIWRCVHTLQ
ncbi:unnamed protein product [Arabis nemorensis]|uniref:Uncharacterized protein n=1 Tax=Arabis nemorensis TaxID=586526 RepID=A0A565AQ66_9BRAS|nr:unnamed protein product [Arabis nemorensis]